MVNVFALQQLRRRAQPGQGATLLRRRVRNTHTQGSPLSELNPGLPGYGQDADVRLAGSPGSAGRRLFGLQVSLLAQEGAIETNMKEKLLPVLQTAFPLVLLLEQDVSFAGENDAKGHSTSGAGGKENQAAEGQPRSVSGTWQPPPAPKPSLNLGARSKSNASIAS